MRRKSSAFNAGQCSSSKPEADHPCPLTTQCIHKKRECEKIRTVVIWRFLEPLGADWKNKIWPIIYLSQVNGEVDLIVFHPSGQGRTLPPGVQSVHGVFGRMLLVRSRGVAFVTKLQRENTRIAFKVRHSMLEKVAEEPKRGSDLC